MKIEDIAKICHEANRVFCESIGDMTQPFWQHAPDWQKSSAMNGVEFVLENLDANWDATHNNWMKEKIDNGWVYGEEKNTDKKTHPCLVPFDELPKEQQLKDVLFKNIVMSFHYDIDE